MNRLAEALAGPGQSSWMFVLGWPKVRSGFCYGNPELTFWPTQYARDSESQLWGHTDLGLIPSPDIS